MFFCTVEQYLVSVQRAAGGDFAVKWEGLRRFSGRITRSEGVIAPAIVAIILVLDDDSTRSTGSLPIF